ncbi:MAG TPA: recombinase family protein, partial [Chloroflexi bacterium]|nr:recombinase family protein [Chloroflexota bacterium]
HIVGEFFEDPTRPTSGADWLPELERALELAHQNGYDVLIVREIDRLARNRFKQLAIETDLEALDKRVEYVIGQFEDTVEGKLLKGIMSEFSEFERAKTRQRTMRGMANSVKGGSVIIGGAKAPYGYDAESIDGKRQLVVNEAEAATIRLIFDLYAKGKTLYRIKQYLDKHHISKPAKSDLHKGHIKKDRKIGWQEAQIGKILANETYVGRWYYRKTRRVKGADGKYRQRPRPKNEWLMVEVSAIVSEELFTRVQQQRNINKHIKNKQEQYTYFLGGMMTCDYCGKSVSGIYYLAGGKDNPYKKRYYKCNAAHTQRRYNFKCEGKAQEAKKVDAAVWNWLKSILLDPATLQRSIDEYQEAQEDMQNPILRMIEASEKKLINLEAQLKRLIDAYSTGVLSLDDLAKTKTDLDKQIANTRKAIESLQADLDPETLTAEDINAIHQFAAAFRQNVDLIDADLPARREIAKLLQVKVKLANTHITASCVLGGGSHSKMSFSKVKEAFGV